METPFASMERSIWCPGGRSLRKGITDGYYKKSNGKDFSFLVLGKRGYGPRRIEETSYRADEVRYQENAHDCHID